MEWNGSKSCEIFLTRFGNARWLKTLGENRFPVRVDVTQGSSKANIEPGIFAGKVLFCVRFDPLNRSLFDLFGNRDAPRMWSPNPGSHVTRLFCVVLEAVCGRSFYPGVRADCSGSVNQRRRSSLTVFSSGLSRRAGATSSRLRAALEKRTSSIVPEGHRVRRCFLGFLIATDQKNGSNVCRLPPDAPKMTIDVRMSLPP